MDTMNDTKMQPATDAVIEELRMQAEDLYVNGYNRYSSAMSKAADEIEWLRAKITEMEVGKREISEAHNAVTRRLSALADENTALRVKIERMEKQEPIATVIKEGDSRYWMSERLWTFPDGKYPLYALPIVASKLDEIKTTLQRALELGQRETWTGARKHRSREDQREEQQCWNKVWSLLGAKGEKK